MSDGPAIKRIGLTWVVSLDGVTWLYVSNDGKNLILTDTPDPWAADITIPIAALPALRLALRKIDEESVLVGRTPPSSR